MTEPGSKTNGLRQPREEINIKYMHKPPTIPPNYGSPKRTILPKSKLSRVLLYDNATQDHMLEIKLAHINIEKERISRLLNLNKRSFTTRQRKKPHVAKMAGNGSKDVRALPDIFGHSKKENQNFVKLDKLTSSSVIDLREGKMNSNNLVDLRLPIMDSRRRHFIFKVKDTTGITRIYQTEDRNNLLNEIVPNSKRCAKLTDDPRFQSLENILVPSDRDPFTTELF